MRRVQRDDLVEIRAGKDRGRRGQVRQVIPRRNRVIVTGINMVKRHMQPTQMGAPGGDHRARGAPARIESRSGLSGL